MSKHHFHTLLRRYRNGECTEQEKRVVEQWFSLLDGDVPKRTQPQNQQLEERIWQAIQHRQQPAAATPVRQLLPWRNRNWRWAAAAALVLTLGWAGYEISHRQQGLPISELIDSQSAGGLQKRTNTTDKLLICRLYDGTQIHLAPNSSVEFPAKFAGGKRDVFLTGKAFFRVARNPQKPFLVYTGDIVTKVLGTSFWVNAADDNRSVEVSVMTGRVSVFQRDARNDYVSDKIKSGVILTPNQRVTYTRQGQTFVTGLVEYPVVIAPEKSSEVAPVVPFVFDDAPLGKVVARLEQAYGIDIILENDQLSNCLFTADITRQPLFTKLDLLCSALNASYEVRGTKVLVSGSGCSANP